jgi:sporulation protein YlmC with PRC-barrel domain
MKNASNVLGLQVVGIKEGITAGKPQSFVVNPETRKVEYLLLRESKGDGATLLGMQSVVGMGEDYIVINSLHDIKKAYQSKTFSEALERGFSLIGISILSVSGDILGEISDFEMDEKTGELGTIFGEGGIAFNSSEVVTITKNFVFVNKGDVVITLPDDDIDMDDESIAYLIGRTLIEDIASDNELFRAAKGTIITKELIREAQENDCLVQLTMNAE